MTCLDRVDDETVTFKKRRFDNRIEVPQSFRAFDTGSCKRHPYVHMYGALHTPVSSH